MSPAIFVDWWRPGYPRDHQPRRGLAGSLPPTSTTSSGAELIGARDTVVTTAGLLDVAASAVLPPVVPHQPLFWLLFWGFLDCFLADFFLGATLLASFSALLASSLTLTSALARASSTCFWRPLFSGLFLPLFLACGLFGGRLCGQCAQIWRHCHRR